jgi:hypothetical protein
VIFATIRSLSHVSDCATSRLLCFAFMRNSSERRGNSTASLGWRVRWQQWTFPHAPSPLVTDRKSLQLGAEIVLQDRCFLALEKASSSRTFKDRPSISTSQFLSSIGCSIPFEESLLDLSPSSLPRPTSPLCKTRLRRGPNSRYQQAQLRVAVAKIRDDKR